MARSQQDNNEGSGKDKLGDKMEGLLTDLKKTGMDRAKAKLVRRPNGHARLSVRAYIRIDGSFPLPYRICPLNCRNRSLRSGRKWA